MCQPVTQKSNSSNSSQGCGHAHCGLHVATYGYMLSIQHLKRKSCLSRKIIHCSGTVGLFRHTVLRMNGEGRNILITVDESPASDKVFEWALKNFYRVSAAECVLNLGCVRTHWGIPQWLHLSCATVHCPFMRVHFPNNCSILHVSTSKPCSLLAGLCLTAHPHHCRLGTQCMSCTSSHLPGGWL